jgi:CheY-like chemotaxis protein
MRILLVDDDDDVTLLLEELLEAVGHEVDRCRNGAEAVDFLGARKRPDRILLDLDMPILDGYRFREVQMQVPAWARIPVIVLTGDAYVDAARLAGATLLYKPVTVEKLMAALIRQEAA